MNKCEFLKISEVRVNNRKSGLFKCVCGNLFVARLDHIKTGNTNSCGCHRLNRLREETYTSYNIGDNINGFTFICEEGLSSGIRNVKVNCKLCNTAFVTRLTSINNGHTKSCGCHKTSSLKKRLTTHDRSRTREYHIWQHIKGRCTNSNLKSYANYGGRGITVCSEWLLSFDSFYRDMGDSPTDKHSIDRVDNDKGYCKENCRWATNKEQSLNKRKTVFMTYNGVTKPLQNFIDDTGLCRKTVRDRLRKGWDIEKAFDYKITI